MGSVAAAVAADLLSRINTSPPIAISAAAT